MILRVCRSWKMLLPHLYTVRVPLTVWSLLRQKQVRREMRKFLWLPSSDWIKWPIKWSPWMRHSTKNCRTRSDWCLCLTDCPTAPIGLTRHTRQGRPRIIRLLYPMATRRWNTTFLPDIWMNKVCWTSLITNVITSVWISKIRFVNGWPLVLISLIPTIQAMEEALWEQERIGEVLFWRLSILRRMLRFGTLWTLTSIIIIFMEWAISPIHWRIWHVQRTIKIKKIVYWLPVTCCWRFFLSWNSNRHLLLTAVMLSILLSLILFPLLGDATNMERLRIIGTWIRSWHLIMSWLIIRTSKSMDWKSWPVRRGRIPTIQTVGLTVLIIVMTRSRPWMRPIRFLGIIPEQGPPNGVSCHSSDV